MDSVVN